MSEIEARTVTRYYCKACGRGWQRKGMAESHADRCWHDPEHRACPTCGHFYFNPKRDDDRSTGFYTRPVCHAGCWYQDDAYHTDCKTWIPKQEVIDEPR